MKRLSIEYINETAKRDYGLELLSKDYTSNTSLLEWRNVLTGEIIYKSWANVKRGNTGTSKKIEGYRKARNFIENYKGLGYTYNLSEDEFYKEDIKRGNRIYSITNPGMPGVWKVTLTNFKRSATTHLNRSSKSYGEVLVKSILVNNSIKFEEQKQVIIKGHSHRFDFYLPEYTMYIEYDGEQHYKESSGFYKGKLNQQKSKDHIKDDYVRDTKGIMVRIPYTEDTQKSIIDILSRKLGVKLISGKIYPTNLDSRIVDTYLNNDLKETSEILNVHATTITRTFKKVTGMTKREYVCYNNTKSKRRGIS